MSAEQLAEVLSLKIIEMNIQDGKVSEYNVVDRYNKVYELILDDIKNENNNDFSSEII